MGAPMRAAEKSPNPSTAPRRAHESELAERRGPVRDLEGLIAQVRSTITQINVDGFAAGQHLGSCVQAELVPGVETAVSLPKPEDFAGDAPAWRRAWEDLCQRLEAHRDRLVVCPGTVDEQALQLLPAERELLAAIEALRK